MSITQDEYEAKIRARLSGLMLLQKHHTLQRTYRKIRLIHNDVGDVYMRRQTFVQFQAKRPNVFAKIRSELRPFLIGDYLSKEGWEYFLTNMFTPRDMVLLGLILELRAELRGTAADLEIDPMEDEM